MPSCRWKMAEKGEKGEVGEARDRTLQDTKGGHKASPAALADLAGCGGHPTSPAGDRMEDGSVLPENRDLP